jgi:hypothetical protein
LAIATWHHTRLLAGLGRDAFYLFQLSDLQEHCAQVYRPRGPASKNPNSRHCAVTPQQFRRFHDNWQLLERSGLAASPRIVVLPNGQNNPRRPGTPPHQRYESLLQSATIGEFLQRHPGWITTVQRAVREGYIKIVD